MNTDPLFELPKDNLKNKWLRESGKFMNVIQKLEQELKRMKANPKVSPEMINEKDEMITELVDFYNSTDQLINEFQTLVATHRINDKLNSQIFKKNLDGKAR
jgi:predicted HNH restriction endonuclease